MRTTNLVRALALAALGFAAIGALPAAAQDAAAPAAPKYVPNRVEGATLAALKLAFRREVNAEARYRVFAAVAKREGHPGTRILFLAIADAERIHSTNLRAQIERLDDEAVPVIESFRVGTTAENLRNSIDVEAQERDAVYRAFGEFALKECSYEALAAFNYARGAEGTHARVFGDELARLERETRGPRLLASLFPGGDPEPGVPDVVVLVCGGCGSAFDAPPGRSCPNCGTSCAELRSYPVKETTD